MDARRAGLTCMSLISPNDLYYLGVIVLIQLNDLFRSPTSTRALIHILGRLAYFLSVNKKHQIQTNLSGTFASAADPAGLQRIVRGSLNDFWREMLSWSNDIDLMANPTALTLDGITHLEAALEHGKGVILWESNGFGQRLLAKKILFRKGFAVVQVHGPNNLGGFLTGDPRATRVRREWVKPFFDRRERAFTAGQIDLPDSDSMIYTRAMMDCLTGNGILCAAGDGRVGQKQIRIWFLGHQIPFSTGLVSMARLTGAPILPLFCYQQSDRLCLEIGAPLDLPADMPREDLQRAVLQQYAAQLETHIREFPEQYRNWHLLATP